MSNSVRPHRRQPTRLPRPWDSPGKNTGVGCHFLLQCMKVKSQSEVAQSCLTLSDPMDCSLPGSSVHGIFQARVLAWGAIVLSEAISNCPLLFPSSILDTFQSGGLIFQCHIFLPFHTVHEVPMAGILEWVAIFSSSGPRCVGTVYCDPSVLGGLTRCGAIALLSYTSPFTMTRM